MPDTKTSLGDVISIVYLTPQNAVIDEKNGFLTLTFTPSNDSGTTESITYERIFLHRAFPFDHPESFLSVQDADKNEIGMIADISVFPQETVALLRNELARKYYAPQITAIHSIRDRYGYAYCSAETANGDIRFTLRDASRSILKVGQTRVIITDIDGNRYDIPDITQLDRKSYRRIELYL